MSKESIAEDGWVPELIPVRMLNEFAYCPRLSYIEWVQGEFVDSADTVDGRFQHRRVDRTAGSIPEEDDSEVETFHARSVDLSGTKTGVVCRIDLLEGKGRLVTPVDYKRGRVPDIQEGAYEPERVQLCAQGLVLRENGFECHEGLIYYVQSKTKVVVPFDPDLIERTTELIQLLREVAKVGRIPPPLDDSVKCIRCSLASICLPDEVQALKKFDEERCESESIRRLFPSRDDQVPLYVVGQGQTVRKRGERLEIWSRTEKTAEAKLREISQISLFGGASITTPALSEILQRGIPVCHFSYGGWFYGMSQGTFHKNIELRIQQYKLADDSIRSLQIARQLINGKIRNCRTLLRRNDSDIPKDYLITLNRLAKDALDAAAPEILLGIEGASAQIYFSRFNDLLKIENSRIFFENRNKRPPKDPVNAVLSYLYGVMVKEFFVTLLSAGFDPYLGFFHRPRYGRPALALDLMEEFRPLLADSTALTLFNNGELTEKDFINRGVGVSLTPKGKKTVIAGYERRMNTEITHPIFGYKVSYRRILEVQTRLLSRVVLGEIDEYPPFCTR